MGGINKFHWSFILGFTTLINGSIQEQISREPWVKQPQERDRPANLSFNYLILA